MASTTFPNLSCKPRMNMQIETIDNSLKSETVSGYTITRKKYSRQLKTFSVNYPAMHSGDLQSLQTFYQQCNGGAATFNWICPDDNNTYTVRFDSNLMRESVSNIYWSVSFKLAEV